MLKRYFIFIVLVYGFLYGNNFENIAKNFLLYKGMQKRIVSSALLQKNKKVVGHLFNLSNGGYIIVPIFKNISPIKAFSFDRNYKNLPQTYKNFLLNKLYLYASSRILSKNIEAKISDRWNFLKNYQDSGLRKLYHPNNNLLTTTWNQTYPYNMYLPKVSNQNVVTGCVQTAVAQIMRYYSYPKIAKGIVSRDIPIKNSSGSTIRVDHLKAFLHRYYDWSSMPNDATYAKEYQKEAVAYLMQDLLVVDDVQYAGTELTGADVNIRALIENYGYSSDIKRVYDANIGKDKLLNIITDQIDKKQPILISFPTHMAVVDGYDIDSTGNYVHINLGWGGYANDYYNLDIDNTVGGYSLPSTGINIVYNIKPCSKDTGDCYKNLEADDILDGVNINGMFDNSNDEDKYKIFLKGDVSFQGSRGYGNQAFFIDLYDSKGDLIKEMEDSSTLKNLPADLYTVLISLNGSQYSYNYDENYKKYNVKIESNNLLSESEKKSILQSLETPVIISNNIKDQVMDSEKKVLVNAYDANNDDDITFSARSTSSVSVTFKDNILTIKPNVKKGFAKVEIKIKSGNDIKTENFSVLVNDTPIHYGKRIDLAGHFDNNSDIYNTKVILEGTCSIKGYRGYSNQAFYIALLDSDYNYLNNFSDAPFDISNLNFGFYNIEASLNNNGSYFTYNDNFANYNINIECPNADENITKIAKLVDISTDINSSLEISDPSPIKLKEGWNLISFNGDLKSMASIKIAWQYSNNNWKVYAPLLDTKDYKKLNTDISSNLGTWVRVENDTTIYTDKSAVSFAPSYSKGWSLSGTSQEISVNDILCGDTNSTPSSIWKYTDGVWLLHTEVSNNLGLDNFIKIESQKGFWVNCSR